VSGASIWQSDSKVSDLPYILCESGRLKVGYQNVSVQIADQEASFSAADEVLRTSCDDGYYGQEAWTPYMINGDIAYDQFEINGETAQDDYDIDDADDRIQWRNPYPNFPYESCQARNKWVETFDPYLYETLFAGSYNEERDEEKYLTYNMDPNPLECMQKGGYERSTDSFLTEGYEMCDYYRRCLIGYDDITLKMKTNYTVINTANEYCIECPTGATCDDAVLGTLYPVEPYADEGYWRYEFPMESDYCSSRQQSDHSSRPYCYDIWPCQPAEACTGGNQCKKGYTGEGCNLCCDALNGSTPMTTTNARSSNISTGATTASAKSAPRM
jgi:hypothetical protein